MGQEQGKGLLPFLSFQCSLPPPEGRGLGPWCEGLGKVTSASQLRAWLPSQSQQDQWCLAWGFPVPRNWGLASLLLSCVQLLQLWMRPNELTGRSRGLSWLSRNVMVPESAFFSIAVFLELTDRASGPQAGSEPWATATSPGLCFPLLSALDLPFCFSADSSLLGCQLPALRAGCREQGGPCTLDLLPAAMRCGLTLAGTVH